jgi:hypothetical protein
LIEGQEGKQEGKTDARSEPKPRPAPSVTPAAGATPRALAPVKPPQARAPAQPPVRTTPAPAPTPAPAAEEPDADVDETAETARAPFRAASQQPMRIAPETTASAGASDDAGGGYAVQLSASPSETEARATAQRMQQRFGGEFGGRGPSVRKAEVGGKTVFRVRVGGLSKESATAMCGRLQSAGGSCFVARN